MWTPPNTQFPPPKADEPPLHRAARVGDHRLIRELIGQGADIDAVFDIALDPDCCHTATPLMVAAGSGDGATVETVRLLIELGADPAHVEGRHSAATMACGGLGWNYRPGGDADRLQLLLTAGAPLPSRPSDAHRALCEAAEAGSVDRVRALLNHGLDPNGHWDPDEARATHRRMMEKMAEYRERMPDPFMTEEIRESMNAMAEESLEEDCAAPMSHEIPLFCAASSGCVSCVSLLLDAGADVHRRDNLNETALYSASNADVIRTLIEAGLSIEDRNQFEWSPLVSALSDGEEGLARVRALIACGADVNATHDRGYTVFMSAVGSERHPDALRLLIESGADPHAVSELGYNAFHAAIDVNGESNREKSVRSTLSYLKGLGLDINHRNERGQTPLGRAIDEGTGTEVRVLCELGADPNAACRMLQCESDECRQVETPLLIAAATGIGVHKDQKVDALLNAGADPMVEDEDGFTASVLTLAKLCADADDYDVAFDTFQDGLAAVLTGFEMEPANKVSYIESLKARLRPYVETFASDIPISQTCQFDAEWRAERLNCIVSLFAFETWARVHDGEA